MACRHISFSGADPIIVGMICFNVIDVVEVDGQYYAVLDWRDQPAADGHVFARVEEVEGEYELVAIADTDEFTRLNAAWTEYQAAGAIPVGSSDFDGESGRTLL